MAINKKNNSKSKGTGSRTNTSAKSTASQPAKEKRLSDEEKIEDAFKTLDKFKNKSHTLAQVIASGSANLFPNNMNVVGPGPNTSSLQVKDGQEAIVKGTDPKPPFHIIADHLLFTNGRLATVLDRLNTAATKTYGGLYQSPSIPEFLKEFSEYFDQYNGDDKKNASASVHEVIQKHVQGSERLADMLLDVSKQIETLS